MRECESDLFRIEDMLGVKVQRRDKVDRPLKVGPIFWAVFNARVELDAAIVAKGNHLGPRRGPRVGDPDWPLRVAA